MVDEPAPEHVEGIGVAATSPEELARAEERQTAHLREIYAGLGLPEDAREVHFDAAGNIVFDVDFVPTPTIDVFAFPKPVNFDIALGAKPIHQPMPIFETQAQFAARMAADQTHPEYEPEAQENTQNQDSETHDEYGNRISGMEAGAVEFTSDGLAPDDAEMARARGQLSRVIVPPEPPMPFPGHERVTEAGEVVPDLTAYRQSPEEDIPPGVGSIYVSSKTKYAQHWIDLRTDGYPIISTWMDHAVREQAGGSADHTLLWLHIFDEIARCAILVACIEDDEIPKGMHAEIGAALALGIPCYLVGFRKYTISKASGVMNFDYLTQALGCAMIAVAAEEETETDAI